MTDASKSSERTDVQAPSRPHGTAAPREVAALRAAFGIAVGTIAVWLVALWGGGLLSRWETPRPPVAAAAYHAAVVARPAAPTLDLSLALRGREIFMTSCNRCHGQDGLGRPDLGKDLVHSDFVAMHDDDAMRAFIARGRDVNDPLNTTKFAMPPRGADPTIGDEELAAVVAYLRGLQDPRRMPELKQWGEDDVQVAVAKMKAKAMECDSVADYSELAEMYGPALGACCNATTGACLQTAFDECGISRVWVIGEACSPNPCVPGACCDLASGACRSSMYTTCEGLAAWKPGAACVPSPCAQPAWGTCCYEDGACFIALRDLCPGAFDGSSTICTPATCPQPMGACCDAAGACVLASKLNCGAALGQYRGNGTMCQPSPCAAVASIRRDGR